MKFLSNVFIPFVYLLSLAILFSCNNESKPTNETIPGSIFAEQSGNPVFDILVGTWKVKDGNSFEQWTKHDNGTYTSVVYSISEQDTSWDEQATIFPKDDKWVFENAVKDQNNGKAIQFTSTILTDHRVQFSNPAHDFPTDVNYTIIDSNTVKAFIIGPGKTGGKDTVRFDYTRVML